MANISFYMLVFDHVPDAMPSPYFDRAALEQWLRIHRHFNPDSRTSIARVTLKPGVSMMEFIKHHNRLSPTQMYKRTMRRYPNVMKQLGSGAP